MATKKGTTQQVRRVSICFLVTLSLIGVLFLTSCAKQEVKPAPVPAPSNPHYTETAIELPEGVQKVDSLEKTDNGKIWMVGDNYQNNKSSTTLWELNDDNSWKELTNFRELLALDEKEYIYASAITKSNKVVCFVSNNVSSFEDYPLTTKFYLIDLELEKGYRELNIDASEFIGDTDRISSLIGLISGMYPLKNDRLFICNQSSSYVLDITHETIKQVPYEEGRVWQSFYGAAELGDTLHVLYGDSINDYAIKLGTFDVSTGSLNDIDSKELTDLLIDENAIGFRIFPTLAADYDSAERITICLKSGIIEYSDSGARRIVDAEGTILSDTSKNVERHGFNNQDDFFLLSWSPYNAEAPSLYSLYKYEKSSGA